jgi:hypothetical protein
MERAKKLNAELLKDLMSNKFGIGLVPADKIFVITF